MAAGATFCRFNGYLGWDLSGNPVYIDALTPEEKAAYISRIVDSFQTICDDQDVLDAGVMICLENHALGLYGPGSDVSIYSTEDCIAIFNAVNRPNFALIADTNNTYNRDSTEATLELLPYSYSWATKIKGTLGDYYTKNWNAILSAWKGHIENPGSVARSRDMAVEIEIDFGIIYNQTTEQYKLVLAKLNEVREAVDHPENEPSGMTVPEASGVAHEALPNGEAKVTWSAADRRGCPPTRYMSSTRCSLRRLTCT